LLALHTGPRKLLAAIFDRDAIVKILMRFGLPTEPPSLAARPPPMLRLPC
jgi:hypothetical protein